MTRPFIILLALVFVGCGMVQRHSDSGYNGNHGAWDDVGEPSHGARTKTLSQDERTQVEGNVEIRRLETNLRSEDEYDQYNKYKGTMSAKERAEFLRMKDASARKRWVQAKGIKEDRSRFPSSITAAVEDGDIALGMPKEAVKESWGDPELMEVAGNPNLGNERWTYTRYLSSAEGFQEEHRIIYFEGGQVIGWERH
jgi:hypothetical protein